jgi:hypothetical protein
MGNAATKEARGAEPATSPRAPQVHTYIDPAAANNRTRTGGNRVSRADLNLFGLGTSIASGSQGEQPFERRETKQEREARRLERERAARLKERERSLREEHVDGGYLVTLGTYTGIEDFNKQVVRQLQVWLATVQHRHLQLFLALGLALLTWLVADRTPDSTLLARTQRFLP